MPRKLKYDVPGTDWRVRLEDIEEKGLDRIFGDDLPRPLQLLVDIGFGRGEFLIELAEKRADSALLGVEYSFKRVLKMARRLARSGLRNVRLVEAPAEHVVRCLADASVHGVWINFPDPWPKKRHQRRRLIQPPFVSQLVRCLEPGGRLDVATDHQGYADQIACVLEAEQALENLFAPESYRRELQGRAPTAYELEWRSEGRELHFFSYRKRAARSRRARLAPACPART
jgi:tRNA (guanine-N7-)-methyltransferase